MTLQHFVINFYSPHDFPNLCVFEFLKKISFYTPPHRFIFSSVFLLYANHVQLYDKDSFHISLFIHSWNVSFPSKSAIVVTICQLPCSKCAKVFFCLFVRYHVSLPYNWRRKVIENEERVLWWINESWQKLN